MRNVILTNEPERVINDGGHRVVRDDAIRLFTAADAATVLHISRNAVYALWRKGLLDYWNINGTKLTNLTAISDFLERTKNADQLIDREEL